MASAFQATAFQNTAFQIDAAVQPDQLDPGGDRIIRHRPGGTFSRKRWRELQALLVAQKEAEQKARNTRARGVKKAVSRATEAASEAIEAVSASPLLDVDLLPLAGVLSSLAEVRTARDAKELSVRAVELAQMIEDQISEDDEDEAIALLFVL